jgi:hypothetical protein
MIALAEKYWHTCTIVFSEPLHFGLGANKITLFKLSKTRGFIMYHQVYHYKILHGAIFFYFIRTSEQTVTFAVYDINWLVFITLAECVSCKLRTDSVCKADYVQSLRG